MNDSFLFCSLETRFPFSLLVTMPGKCSAVDQSKSLLSCSLLSYHLLANAQNLQMPPNPSILNQHRTQEICFLSWQWETHVFHQMVAIFLLHMRKEMKTFPAVLNPFLVMDFLQDKLPPRCAQLCTCSFMQQLPVKIAGQKANGFFLLKPSATTAQFWLSNTKVALQAKHLKEKAGTNPQRKGWLAVSKQAIRED